MTGTIVTGTETEATVTEGATATDDHHTKTAEEEAPIKAYLQAPEQTAERPLPLALPLLPRQSSSNLLAPPMGTATLPLLKLPSRTTRP